MASSTGSANDESGTPSARRPRVVLPAWLDHFNRTDLKVLFRCWTAAWVATLLIFITPVLHRIGIATFFGALVLYIVPPAGILFVYLLASLSLLAGMCLGWAWGLLTMKAALAARPASQTQARLLALVHQAAAQAQQSGRSVATVAQELVHDGFMLDARVTVVFYVMICVFVYAMARLRVANNKFILAQIFSTIIADLFLLFGPTLPSFTASLAEVLVEPGAIGVGLGAACCLLFFPQSTSYAVLTKMEQLLRLGRAPLECTVSRLDGDALSLSHLIETKAKIIGTLKAIDPLLAFLPLDFSRGRWNADDVRSLQQPVRKALLATLSLLEYHLARIHSDQNAERLEATDASPPNSSAPEKRDRAVGHHQLQASAEMMHAFRSPEEEAIRERTRQALRHSTIPLLQASSGALDVVAESVRVVNSRRWIGAASQAEIDQQAARAEHTLDALRTTRASSLAATTEALIESHSEMFDAEGWFVNTGLGGAHALRGIVIGMVIEERILAVAQATEGLLDQIQWLLRNRTKTRLWIPSHLQYALSWLSSGSVATPMAESAGTTAVDPEELEQQQQQQTAEAERLLRISRGYGTPQRSRLTRGIIAGFHWLFNPAGMYALRLVVVTIATAIPSALPHTAGFYYREKGIWGVITAQTTLVVYMADFTFSLGSRAAGTVIGGVLGMVAWYIGSGLGPGNAYGLGAITAAMTAVLMWWRIFLPPAFTPSTIMSGVTFVLVVGFSYDDGHTQQYGLPGRGYTAFYKRLVTVLLGFLAAFVVQLFPRPPSATRHICHTLSGTVRTLSDHYALVLSHWARADPSHPLATVADRITLELAETLLSLTGPIALLRLEMSIGPFHRRTLQQTQSLCGNMNQALGRLLLLSTTLPLDLQSRFQHTVGLNDDFIVGEIMAVLGVIEQALKAGVALPERLPTPLVKRCVEAWQREHRVAELSKDLVRDENYRRYCVALSSYLKFLAAVDELVLVLKGGLGEAHVVDRGEDYDMV
ncbi:hypothetical protein BO70DRAFT_378043 [Aspergillus heteromorphus CBS 117.55]|uniref:ER transporter 6TM N-terminal domain-containing protein n=1 Tax=Aspergillus heteromorphus CBS 117.55 TaxID=1448321 RepID=A0A317WQ31_9EURO|nr:uncharacterized protein BO70DRAFT_378043 [Aspergillus heteromorphus CBS 117.55]PWY87392.1 hypothetical protein BO70DRAFT_378043 [Aspergillus heteromorphus CBS 117.55]